MTLKKLILTGAFSWIATGIAHADTLIHISDFKFSPDSVQTSAGSTVTWINDDAAHHSLSSNDGLFDSQLLNHGESFSYTFKQPGIYSYHCGVHKYMTGTIVVKQ